MPLHQRLLEPTRVVIRHKWTALRQAPQKMFVTSRLGVPYEPLCKFSGDMEGWHKLVCKMFRTDLASDRIVRAMPYSDIPDRLREDVREGDVLCVDFLNAQWRPDGSDDFKQATKASLRSSPQLRADVFCLPYYRRPALVIETYEWGGVNGNLWVLAGTTIDHGHNGLVMRYERVMRPYLKAEGAGMQSAADEAAKVHTTNFYIQNFVNLQGCFGKGQLISAAGQVSLLGTVPLSS